MSSYAREHVATTVPVPWRPGSPGSRWSGGHAAPPAHRETRDSPAESTVMRSRTQRNDPDSVGRRRPDGKPRSHGGSHAIAGAMVVRPHPPGRSVRKTNCGNPATRDLFGMDIRDHQVATGSQHTSEFLEDWCQLRHMREGQGAYRHVDFPGRELFPYRTASTNSRPCAPRMHAGARPLSNPAPMPTDVHMPWPWLKS